MQTSSGYVTRPYAGSRDLPGMVDVINAVRRHDGVDEVSTVAEMAQQYEHLQRCDPATDIVVAEADGVVVGYARTLWDDVAEGYRVYWLVVEFHPDHPEVEDWLYEWVENRARANADAHPAGDKRLGAWANEATPKAKILRARGFGAVRYGATLVRPNLDDIPDLPLPDGVEVRPVTEADLRQIWEADVEAFRDHRGYVEQTETDWEAWLDFPYFEPDLWQVAWAGDQVVGQVRSFIDSEENETFGRLRGWTEFISTARNWRRRGIAASLIASSLGVLEDRGMTEAALGVDTENPNQAMKLYESLGFVRTELFADYEKRI